MSGSTENRLYTLFLLGGNILCSISIVLVNKWIYTMFGFPNMTLTCIHFVCTFLGLIVCNVVGIFELKKIPLLQVVPLALTFCGFVVFTNLSLQHNTVGTYQIIKCLTTPCIIVIQTYFYGQEFSRKIVLTLIPITIGVYMNSAYDLKFNMTGLIYAGIGVLVTSLYQVWVGTKQKDLGVSAMQLLIYQAPMSAVLLAVIIMFFESPFGEKGLLSAWSFSAIMFVLLSGCIAFLVNLSIFLIIGKFSPVTYNMVGHLKFCTVMVGGFLIFQDPLTILQGTGIGFTLTGLVAYTHFKVQEQKLRQDEKATTPQKADSAPLGISSQK